MELIDTSDAVVRQLVRQMDQQGISANPNTDAPSLSLLSTANANTLKTMAQRLLLRDLSQYTIYTETLKL
jgi:glutamate racemase